MNFISGRNGSGKSAVLAALQICLGANANSTHRAKKLSDFIRYSTVLYWTVLFYAMLSIVLFVQNHLATSFTNPIVTRCPGCDVA